MTWEEALVLASRPLQMVVDLLAKQDYQSIGEVVVFQDLSVSLLQEIVEGFLQINELSGMDTYGTPCNFHPNYAYQQITGGLYKDQSGFWLDYDLTTNGELNDLTLQMSFLFEADGQIKPILLDLHVL